MMIYPNREMKKSIKEQVEEMLFEDIVCGVYPPGTVLNEGTLTKKFGVANPLSVRRLSHCAGMVY